MKTALDRDIEETIKDWPPEPQDSARRLIDTYGDPDEYSASYIIWHAKAKPWKRTILSKETARHDFPRRHNDFIEQVIDYRVPTDKFDDIASYDGSVMIERTKGELSARCGGTSKNFLAINLAVEIAEGKRTVDDARRAYAEIAKRFDEGDEDPYTREFRFELPKNPTGDPDVPAV